MSTIKDNMEVPTYVIDLEHPPEKRWLALVGDYKEHILRVVAICRSQYPLIDSPLCRALSSSAFGKDIVCHEQEIESIASVLGIPAHIVLILQLLYEVNACCTSIITYRKEVGSSVLTAGKECLQLIRTMDWPLEELRKITVNIEIRRGSHFVCNATTWAGYVGILTGTNRSFSVSVNFRRTNGDLLKNMANAMRGYWPVGYLVRHILFSAGGYSDAVKALKKEKLISPTYFCVAGMLKGEGAIIIRSPKTALAQTLGDTDYLIQTNMDSEEDKKDILRSHARYKQAEKYLLNRETVKESDLWTLMGQYPINNSETIYTSYMSCGSLVTRL